MIQQIVLILPFITDVAIGKSGRPMNSMKPVQAVMTAFDYLNTAAKPFSQTHADQWQFLLHAKAANVANYHVQRLLQIIEGRDGGLAEKDIAKHPGLDFFVANYYQSQKKDFHKALLYYSKVTADSPRYADAVYHSAVALAELGKLEEAHKNLSDLIDDRSLFAKTTKEFQDLAYLAVARIDYQNEDFMSAIHFYRKVSRSPSVFYQTLFEESWALFMAGYPRHALGMIYDLSSPFFNKRFAPEALLVKSLSHYWMCRYSDAKIALSKFYEVHGARSAAVNNFLTQPGLSPERAYQIFEDFIAGVSEKSLGVPSEILQEAAGSDEVMALRYLYADVMDEKASEGKGDAALDRKYDELISMLQEGIGSQVIKEFKVMKVDSEQLTQQGKFLQLELLMGEKEHLLGKELHASLKVTPEMARKSMSGWSNDEQTWASDSKKEFWWDEVGFHVADVESECRE